VVTIKSLTKTYKEGKKAVDDLSLEIKAGDIYGFIGHNGAGKTTTMKCLAGIIDFDEGEILIDGKSIKDRPIECKSIIAYLPDSPDLYDNMTGMQYLTFVCDIFGISKSEREERIKKYADAFSITSNLGDVISSYSHGMQQKIAIISALVHKPKLLILDEPFVGLDPKAAYLLKEFIKDMCKEGGAVFFSTHMLDAAEKFCNKIAIINNSKLVAEGETEKIVGDSNLETLFLELVDNEKQS